MEDIRREASSAGEAHLRGLTSGPQQAPACVSISTAFGDLLLDQGRFRSFVDDRSVPLTRVEFDLLAHLAQNAHRVVTYGELFAEVIRAAHQPGASLLRVHLTHLRRKLGPLGQAIETVRGRGLALRQVAMTPTHLFSSEPARRTISDNLAES